MNELAASAIATPVARYKALVTGRTPIVRAETNRDRYIQVLVDGHGLAGQRVSPAALFDLPPAVLDRLRVIFAHHPLSLDREDPVQVCTSAAPERGAFRWTQYLHLVSFAPPGLDRTTNALTTVETALRYQRRLPGDNMLVELRKERAVGRTVNF